LKPSSKPFESSASATGARLIAKPNFFYRPPKSERGRSAIPFPYDLHAMIYPALLAAEK